MKALLPDITLDYQETGDGSTPIIFLHGFPFNQTMWTPQWEPLKREFKLITYDHRGHGQSEAGDGQYPLEFFVDDLFGMLEYLRLPKVIIMGLSMGGYIALRAVEREPQRFKALVLCDTRSEADSNEAKLNRASAIKTVKKQGVSVFAEGFLKAVLAPSTISSRPDIVQTVREMINGNSAVGICGTLLALATRTDTTAALAGFKLPTLILVGEQDGVTPPSASQAMNQRIVGSRLATIPNAGHLSNLENPEAFNRHLLEFLRPLR